MPKVIDPKILDYIFTDEDLANGVAGTPVPAKWFNEVQTQAKTFKDTKGHL